MEPLQEKNDLLTWKDLRNHALWWIRLLYQTLHFLFNAWRKHKLLTFSVMSLFILLSLGMLYTRSNVYQMNTTFGYGDLHPKIFGDMVDKLNALVQNRRTEKVAQLMSIPVGQAEKIREVTITDTRGKSLTTNYNLRIEPIIVSLKTAAPIDEDSLRQAITYYLNSDPFTSERLEVKKRLLHEELIYINQKLITIDSILDNLYAGDKMIESDQGAINIENAEGKNAYELLRFSRELIQRRAEVENNLIHPENVIALDNFLLLPQAQFEPASIILNGLIGAVVGFLVSSIIVFWKEKLYHLVARKEG